MYKIPAQVLLEICTDHPTTFASFQHATVKSRFTKTCGGKKNQTASAPGSLSDKSSIWSLNARSSSLTPEEMIAHQWRVSMEPVALGPFLEAKGSELIFSTGAVTIDTQKQKL